ncbi:MAG: 1-phosphofructokinase [Kiritimatiellae bacterium]|nr:1-phosphofructokinase [Kiritimatiellia bacterium]
MDDAPPEFAALCTSPAFDATVPLPALAQPDAVPAAPGPRGAPGGKGLNVARWLARRGRSVALGGLLGAADAAPFEAEMRDRGVRDAMLRVPGPVRRNVCFVAPDGTRKANAPAFPRLSSRDWSAEALLAALAPPGAPPPRAVALTGSLPAAMPRDLYATLARRLAARGVAVALDAAGEALRLGLEAGPCIVKPNREEAEGLLGFAFDGPAAFGRALRALLGSAPVVALSDGAAGCWFAARGEGPAAPFVRFVPSPRVDAVDPTGAGDALLAEFLHRRFASGAPAPAPETPPTEEAMRFAVAAGAAAATTRGALPPDPALVDRLARVI